MSSGTFPLEPLRTVRGIRLRALESALQQCRERHAVAERARETAEEHVRQATFARQDFAERAWSGMFAAGTPTALAMDRYERHLALLDQQIVQRQGELEVCVQAAAETQAALELAAAAWRRAHNKLDAVDQMKQEWLRERRGQAEASEERNLEELFLRQASTH